MDKAEIISKFSSSSEDELFLRKVFDKMESARLKGIPSYTRFLSPAQFVKAKKMAEYCGADFAFTSGWDKGERCVMAFLPDWMEEIPDGEDCPVAVIMGEFAGEYASVSHRDVLGALMGLGIERDTVGDINISENRLYFAVLREITPYIMQNFISAGRAKISIREISPKDAEIADMPSKLIKTTVSSLRIDSILSSGFNMSREKSAALIKSGKVTVDHEECLKPDKLISQGTAITARGSGKICLEEVGKATKKGRTSIVIRKFL